LGGRVTHQEFQKWSAAPIARIITALKAQRPEIPIIAFVRGADTQLPDLARTLQAEAYGLDTALDPNWAVAHTPPTTVLQGNLDPLALVAGGEALNKEIDAITRAFWDDRIFLIWVMAYCSKPQSRMSKH